MSPRDRAALFAITGWLLIAPASGHAGPFELSWYTVDGGGERATAADGMAVDASVGQPDAGQLIGGPYSLNGGFWSITTTATAATTSTTTRTIVTTSSTIAATITRTTATTSSTIAACEIRCTGDDPCGLTRCTRCGTIPAKIENRIDKARRLVVTADGAPRRRARRLLTRSAALLRSAAKLARAAGKTHKIDPACADDLDRALREQALQLRSANQ